MEYTADQVWGLAVRADNTNGGYIKEDEWDYNQTPPVEVRKANKRLVKLWLIEGRQPNEQEVEKGREFRNYLNTFTLRAISTGLNDFERQALNIAQIETFTGRNLFEFSIVSYMPELVRRDRARCELKREIFHSEQLAGEVGEAIVGDVEVISTRFKVEYGKYRVQARMGEAIVDFWFSRDFEPGRCVRIKGKIKEQRQDKTTQLNYVKLL